MLTGLNLRNGQEKLKIENTPPFWVSQLMIIAFDQQSVGIDAYSVKIAFIKPALVLAKKASSDDPVHSEMIPLG